MNFGYPPLSFIFVSEGIGILVSEVDRTVRLCYRGHISVVRGFSCQQRDPRGTALRDSAVMVLVKRSSVAEVLLYSGHVFQ